MFLYGASGHGKVIKEILEALDRPVDGFVDDNPETKELSGVPVRHSTEDVDEVIVSIGDNTLRKKVVDDLECPIAEAAIHPRAVVSTSATVGEGTVVMAGAIINADARIGRHCIVNTGASIDHECQIGDFVHVAPHATLCGAVTVGEGTLVDAGAVIISRVKIGKRCVVAAGSVVLRDIPDGCVAYGNPCKVIKLNLGGKGPTPISYDHG